MPLNDFRRENFFDLLEKGFVRGGRKAFLMELDPLYCDVFVERCQKFTGQSGQRIPRENESLPKAAAQAR